MPSADHRLGIGLVACLAAASVGTLAPPARLVHASAATFEVSADAFGNDANGHSSAPSVDGDGTLIAFESDATNLLPSGQDTNSARDIFVKNVSSGAIVRITVDSSGGQSNGSSYAPSIDSKGEIVAYDSVARNLDSNLTNDCPHRLGDCNRKQDVFIHNLTTGANVLISKTFDGLRSGDGTATAPIISADGTKVIYQSNDDDLTCAAPPCTGEAAKYWNIYSYDIATGVNSLLTPGENGDSKFPWPSAGGASVAFYSTATNLVTSPLAAGTQVYEWAPSGFTLVSHSQPGSGGAVVAGNGVSQLPMMSADGSTIVYDTIASNITSSTVRQTVAYKTVTGQNTVVSACGGSCANGGTLGAPGNHPSLVVYSDATAAHIAFVSTATNISMSAPASGKKSLFLWSPAAGPVWQDVGNAYISGPAIGAGGTTVAWTRSLTNGFNQPTGRVYAMILP